MHDAMFPLRMTSIERLHFYDDWPEYPNNIFARCYFSGRLDVAVAERALILTAERHVWGRAVVRPHGRTLRWEWEPNTKPVFNWADRNEVPFQKLDLRTGPVCRMIARCIGEQIELTFQVHHAVVDGLGGLQYLRDWLVVYDNMIAGREPLSNLSAVDPERLRRRNHLGLTRPAFWLTGWRQLIGLFGATKFIFRRFRVIERESTVGTREFEIGSSNGFPHLKTAVLPEAELKRLKNFVRKMKITTNDWVLAAIFKAVSQWRTNDSDHYRSEWTRVIVPFNLRTADDREMPAANRASLVQIDRRDVTSIETLHLAQGIGYELNLIRRWQLDRMFLLFVRAFSISDRWLRNSVRRDRARATTMVTNVGKPLLRLGLPTDAGRVTSGGLILETLDVIGPIRFGMPISFAVLEHANQLRVCLHYDANVIDATSADDLLDKIAKSLTCPGP